ncbi:MAG: hypothetical protein Q9157_008251 [Trypethelium eluteriae]
MPYRRSSRSDTQVTRPKPAGAVLLCMGMRDAATSPNANGPSKSIRPGTRHRRMVVVCSAWSSSTKNEGIMSLLLQVRRHCLKTDLDRDMSLVQSIRTEHTSTTHDYVRNPKLTDKLIQDINQEREQTIQLLRAQKTIGHGNPNIKDKVIGTGERLTCLFVFAALCDQGCKAY